MGYPNRNTTRPGTTRRVRLRDYDYSHPGYYFVTICTHQRRSYLGAISDSIMHLSPPGEMVERVIIESSTRFDNLTVDSFVVMPNHVHILAGVSVQSGENRDDVSLSQVVHWIKSTVHQGYRSGVRNRDWKPYDGKVWQEGFYDHIIRTDRELELIRAYILNNVQTWEKDTFYSELIIG